MQSQSLPREEDDVAILPEEVLQVCDPGVTHGFPGLYSAERMSSLGAL
jgi:hypothetical protein